MKFIFKTFSRPAFAWDIILLLLRIWLGYIMIRNGRFFYEMIYSEKDRLFFSKWFGSDLHFPFPLLMAFLAKGAEFFGGLLVLLGLYSRIGASLIACTMLVATLSANLGKNWDIDGTITISLCLMAVILIYWGGGKYALASIFKKKY